jgi:hypothetical protein
MRVLVCGGRTYTGRIGLFGVLDREHRTTRITLLIHGACVDPKIGKLRGADMIAEEWALAREVPYVGVPAMWSLHGDAAGPIRNREMLRRFVPELVVAAPGGPGTRSMVALARAAVIEVVEVPR